MNRPIDHAFKAHIRNLAQEKHIDTAQLWQNLVIERFLVRLSRSQYAPHFILKGGVLLSHYIQLNRYTQDLDFLIQKLSNKVPTLEKVLGDVMEVRIGDGFRFTDLKVGHLLHPHMKYPGLQASMWSFFGKTRFQVKLDLGFGDLIISNKMTIPLTGGSKGALFENELEMSCYPKEFIFAEKLETVIYRGVNNSRMKDFHDLNLLVKLGELKAKETQFAVESVLKHRATKKELPIIFPKEDLVRIQKLWLAHLRT